MNRQVLPSMVLSVLIVCFFAVVLFPLEERHAPSEGATAESLSHKREPREAEPPAEPVSTEPREAEPPVEPVSTAAPEGEDASPSEEAENPVVVSSPSASPSGSSKVPEPPPPQTPSASSIPPPAPAASKAVVKEPPPVVEADEPSPTAPETEPEPGSTEQAPFSDMVSIPRSDTEVTIVDAGETLDDVAIRVYGSRTGVETLLRANREVLSRRNGPLRAGLQLWTPER